MAEIHITPAAENDLINIWLYIARDNPEAADRVYQAAEDTFKSLASMPHIGTLYRSKRAQLKGVRFFSVSKFQSYVIYYRDLPKGIEIIRVLDAHMNKQKRLEPK